MAKEAPAFTEEQLRQSAAIRKARPGVHALVVTNAEPHKSKNEENNHVMAKLTCKILSDPNNKESTVGGKITNYVTLPMNNVDVPGHQAESWAFSMGTEWLSALVPDKVDPVPQWEAGQLIFRGEPIEKSQEAACKYESQKEAAEFASKVLRRGPNHYDFTPIINKVFFAVVYYDEGSDYPSIKNMRSELPSKWELESEHEILIGVDGEVSGLNGSGKSKGRAGGRSRAKATGKSKGRAARR